MLKTVYLLCKEKQTCYNTDKPMKNFHCRLVCSTVASTGLQAQSLGSDLQQHYTHTCTYMYTYAHSKYAHT